MWPAAPAAKERRVGEAIPLRIPFAKSVPGMRINLLLQVGVATSQQGWIWTVIRMAVFPGMG